MIGYLSASLSGCVLGIVVVILADLLPAIREAQAAGDDQAPNPPRPFILKDAVLKLRTVPVLVVMAAVSLYLWGREASFLSFLPLVVYVAIFVLIAVIDIEHRLVLDIVMVPAFVIALIEVAINPRLKLTQGLMGYAIGQIAVMGIYLLGAAYLWLVNTGRAEPVEEIPFGFGDVTLATFCGLVVGAPGIIFVLVLMIFVGGAMALLYLLSRLVITRDYQAHTPIPYGPAIVTAALIVLLWGDQITAWVVR
jgi:prepilin signal peptidase PulO-like enzyme (type II secretory pathway)